MTFMTKGHCGEHFRVCGDAAGGRGGGGLRGGREEEPGQGQGRHHHQGRVRPERKVNDMINSTFMSSRTFRLSILAYDLLLLIS